ncbi:MAG TPA: ribosome maturation factor RimP [Sporichthyaceae bacterium]|nr:ribosome maturation factor RimP [Sporichthyaceae bacterium]
MGAAPDRALPARLEAALGPALGGLGVDLEGIEISPAGRRRVLRVVVDRDGGVDLDAVADVSRAVAAVLDADDVMGADPYVLEVTSPGVDRPLTQPRHWRRATGRTVRAELRGAEPVIGRVLAADTDGVELDTGGPAPTRLAYAAVARARVQVEFGSTTAREEEEG